MKQGKQRPDARDVRPTDALFGNVGSSGWHFIRNIKNHKGNKKEADFSHLDHKWTDPEDAA
jgi:hypothetical protein